MARVLIPLAQGCEELEAVTVIDLLRRAGIEVTTAGLDARPVRAARGIRHQYRTTLDSALEAEYNMIVLPGGLPGSDHLRDDERIVELVRRMHEADRYTAAICAAPRVLARAGLLDNRRATSFPGAIDVDAIPGIDYAEDAVVTDGKVVTSRGPGTAMDFALELIGLLSGQAKRAEVEASLQRP